MKPKVLFIFTFIALIFSVSSCFKSQEYPLYPIISDAQFYIINDSAQLSFSFTDGDGDIGLHDSETQAPYDTSSRYHYNLYIDYYEKDDFLGWQRGLDLAGDSITFKYRLEPIIVKGKSRGIKGTMDVSMKDFYNPFSTQSDTIKYSIVLIDKALNESEVLWTDEIVH